MRVVSSSVDRLDADTAYSGLINHATYLYIHRTLTIMFNVSTRTVWTP